MLNPEDVAEGGPILTEMLRQHKARCDELGGKLIGARVLPTLEMNSAQVTIGEPSALQKTATSVQSFCAIIQRPLLCNHLCVWISTVTCPLLIPVLMPS